MGVLRDISFKSCQRYRFQMIRIILVLSLAVFSNAGLLPWTENDRNETEFTAQVPQGMLWDGQCVEDTASRLLRVELGKFDDNTPEACKDSCRELGYAYAGVEYGEECFCGNTPPLMSTIVGQEGCDDPCTGDATQMCGGSWNMNVYQTGPCHVRDMMSAGCSPLPGSQGVFLTDSWHQCGLTCINNPSCVPGNSPKCPSDFVSISTWLPRTASYPEREVLDMLPDTQDVTRERIWGLLRELWILSWRSGLWVVLRAPRRRWILS